MINSLILEPGAQVTDAKSSKWKLEGYIFNNKRIQIRTTKGSEKKNIDIFRLRDSRGVALVPGTFYELSIGNENSKFALVLTPKKEIGPRKIQIKGAPNSKRKVQGIEIKGLSITINCFTNTPFDVPPETMRVKVGNNVQMRKDWASDHYWGPIEFEGKQGKVLSVLKGTKGLSSTTTIEVEFNGVKKRYSIHRIIDMDGVSMCLGWNYRVYRNSSEFRAEPSGCIADNKVTWNDCFTD